LGGVRWGGRAIKWLCQELELESECYEADTDIVRAGVPARKLFLVLEGMVSAEVLNLNQRRVETGPGSWIGWRAVVENQVNVP
jgi:CRP-like cAMP-binding protein